MASSLFYLIESWPLRSNLRYMSRLFQKHVMRTKFDIYVLILYIKLAMESKKMFQMLLSTPTTYCLTKKNLEISKGHSESVYRRRTNNTMTKRKSTKGSTKHTYKTKDRITRTPLKTGGKLRCSGRVSSFCSTSGTRRFNLATNKVISREWGKDREVFTTSGTYPWSFVTQIFHSSQPSHGGDRKITNAYTYEKIKIHELNVNIFYRS
jgi:hypothetical protein